MLFNAADNQAVEVFALVSPRARHSWDSEQLGTPLISSIVKLNGEKENLCTGGRWCLQGIPWGAEAVPHTESRQCLLGWTLGCFSAPSRWIQPGCSLGPGKRCGCLGCLCNAVPRWARLDVVGRGALMDSDPPTYTKIPDPVCQIRPKVWLSMKFVFASPYGERDEYFVIFVKMYVVHTSFLSTSVLSHHPQRGGPQNSLGGSEAVCITCRGTLETQQLFWGRGGLGAFWGVVREGKGNSLNSQQIALDKNENFMWSIYTLIVLHFPNRIFSQLFQKRLWSYQPLLHRWKNWEAAWSLPTPSAPRWHGSCRLGSEPLAPAGQCRAGWLREDAWLRGWQKLAKWRLPHVGGVIFMAVLAYVLWIEEGTWGQMAQLFDSSLLRAVWSRNQTASWWKLFMNDFWLMLVKVVGGENMKRNQCWVWPEALLTGRFPCWQRHNSSGHVQRDLQAHINCTCWQFPQLDLVRIANQTAS